jgi:hypothetical protein
MQLRRAHVAQLIVLALFIAFVAHPLTALAGTIDSTDHYAWSDNGGWVNWNPTNGNVQVTDTALTGYIWSANFGWINLSPTNGGVTNNGQGVLGGYAWGENTGWINFSGVTIDGSGLFHGETTAQSVFGTMTFDCTNCSVVTSWRPTVSSSGSTSGGGGGQIVGSGPSAPGYVAPPAVSPTASSVGQAAEVRPYTFSAALQRGSSGPDVTQLQQILIADGFLTITAPTGYFGLQTEAAVKAFQKANGLDQVGIAGPKTRAILNQGSIPTTPETTPTTSASITDAQRQSLIQQLQQQLQALLAQLATLQGQATSTATSTPQ